MQVISQPLPPQNLLDRQTRIAVGQRQEEIPAGGHNSQDHHGGNPRSHQALASKPLAGRDVVLGRTLLAGLSGWDLTVGSVCAKNEFDKSSSDESRGQVRRKVMVEEELTAHHKEGEIMRSPGKEKEAS